MFSDSIMICRFLSCIIQFIVNVAISGSESFDNVRNLRRLFNSMCERISWIVVFNLRKSFKTRNGVTLNIWKEYFDLGGRCIMYFLEYQWVFIVGKLYV